MLILNLLNLNPTGETLFWPKVINKASCQLLKKVISVDLFGDIFITLSNLTQELLVNISQYCSENAERSISKERKNVFSATVTSQNGVLRELQTLPRNFPVLTYKSVDISKWKSLFQQMETDWSHACFVTLDSVLMSVFQLSFCQFILYKNSQP